MTKAASRGIPGGHRGGTNAWKTGPGSKVIVEVSPAAVHKRIEAVFLARDRSPEHVNLGVGCRTLVIVSGKGAIIIHQAIWQSLAGWAKFRLKHTFVAFIGPNPQIGFPFES